ncbi:MAG: glycosyltransferase family 2 protein [Gammaproteobacteria bacterium]|nr:glycosyltransferase family 2 protein [Gammaproteobacteria bacterium]
MNPADIALIVPTFNGGKTWVRWLEAYARQTLRPKHLLVIDSSSQDETATLARAYGFKVHTISQSEFNHGKTRKMAMEILKDANILIYMTQDAILASPDAIEKLITPFSESDVGAVYGRQLPRPGADPIEAHLRLFNYPQKSETRTVTDIPKLGLRAAFISNSFAAYRRRTLEEIGGFPNHIILGEDMYVSAKMLLAGWKLVYQAEAQVYHSHNYTLWQEFKRYFDIGVFHAREPWILEKFGKAEGEGLRYVRSELAFLLKKKPMHIPKALIRLPIKYIAYKLGNLEAFLPKFLKQHLSMHPHFWNLQEN